MDAAALLVTLATLVAVTTYTPPVVGAVYLTEVVVPAVKVPHAFPEHDEPETLHVTPSPVESFSTVAFNVTDCEMVSPYVTGVIATLICAWGCGTSPGNAADGDSKSPWVRAKGLGSAGKPRRGIADNSGKRAVKSKATLVLHAEYSLAPDLLFIEPPNSIHKTR